MSQKRKLIESDVLENNHNKSSKKKHKAGKPTVNKQPTKLKPIPKQPINKPSQSHIPRKEYFKEFEQQWEKHSSQMVQCKKNRTKIINKIFNKVIFPQFHKHFNVLRMHPFGSSTNGLTIVGSDVDMLLEISPQPSNLKRFLFQLGSYLTRSGLAQKVNPVTRASTPIIKFMDVDTNLQCDISINSFQPLINSKWINDFSNLDSRFSKMVIFIKYWAKNRGFLEGSTYLSSYGWINLIIHFFQVVGIFPSLYIDPESELYKSRTPEIYDGVNCIYKNENIHQLKDKSEHLNSLTVGELILSFFKYYRDFNYMEFAISTRVTHPVDKPKECSDPNNQKTFKILYVHDFFTNNNITKGLVQKKLNEIIHQFNVSISSIQNEISFLNWI